MVNQLREKLEKAGYKLSQEARAELLMEKLSEKEEVMLLKKYGLNTKKKR
jgi:hypothetical protein